MNRKVFFTVDKALGALLLEEDSEFVEAIGLDSASELLARSESPDVEDETQLSTLLGRGS